MKCIEANDTTSDYDTVATTCGTKAKLKNTADILTCYKGTMGNQL